MIPASFFQQEIFQEQRLLRAVITSLVTNAMHDTLLTLQGALESVYTKDNEYISSSAENSSAMQFFQNTVTDRIQKHEVQPVTLDEGLGAWCSASMVFEWTAVQTASEESFYRVDMQGAVQAEKKQEGTEEPPDCQEKTFTIAGAAQGISPGQSLIQKVKFVPARRVSAGAEAAEPSLTPVMSTRRDSYGISADVFSQDLAPD
jgi:hypothetical protein